MNDNEKKSPSSQRALQENIDYTINKNGNMVFTAEFLLSRGFCCQSGCQNCPYGIHDSIPTKKKEIGSSFDPRTTPAEYNPRYAIHDGCAVQQCTSAENQNDHFTKNEQSNSKISEQVNLEDLADYYLTKYADEI